MNLKIYWSDLTISDRKKRNRKTDLIRSLNDKRAQKDIQDQNHRTACSGEGYRGAKRGGIHDECRFAA